MNVFISIISFFFKIPYQLYQWFRSPKKKVEIEDTYYFVGVWVAHQINDDQYQSSFYSLWIRRGEKSIPTEKEVRAHLVTFGLNIINFKVISISEWKRSDYDDYVKGEFIEDLIPEVKLTPPKIKEEEIDYQALIDKAIEDENYEEAARLKNILEKKKK